MTGSPEIVEYALMTRHDGHVVRYGRRKGEQSFYKLTGDLVGIIGRSRRWLKDRPQIDRNLAGVTFEKAGR